MFQSICVGILLGPATGENQQNESWPVLPEELALGLEISCSQQFKGLVVVVEWAS